MLCNFPQVCEVFLNYEVVVFQPQKVTPPHLGSVANLTNFISIPPAPPYSIIPLDYSCPSSILPPPTRSSSSSKPSLCLYPLFTSYPCAKRRPLGRRPHPPHVSLRRFYMHPAPHAYVCRRFLWLCDPPLWHTLTAPRSLSAPGRLVCNGSLRLYCAPASSSLSAPLNPRILRFLVSCRFDFCMRARVQGTSTTWNSNAMYLSPPATWPFKSR